MQGDEIVADICVCANYLNCTVTALIMRFKFID